MLEIKKTKQRADGLISRLGMAWEYTNRNFQNREAKRKKKSRTDYLRTVKQPLKHNIYILEREKRERDKKTFEETVRENFSQMTVSHQTTDRENSKNTK